MKMHIAGKILSVGSNGYNDNQPEITIQYSAEDADDKATFILSVSTGEAIEMAKHLYKPVTITIEVNE